MSLASCRKYQGKRAAFTQLTLYLQLRAMRSCRMLDNGQSQAGAASCGTAAVIHAIKALGQPGNMHGVYTDSLVLHLQQALITLH